MSKIYTIGYKRELVAGRTAVGMIGAVFFILAMILGAYIRIPVPGSPVPITLQTFFVLLSGAVLGRHLGLMSQLGYLLIGLAGLPVFQGYASGPAVFLGPTGGYLAGFAVASYFVGAVTHDREAGYSGLVLSLVIGSLIIYAFAFLWLVYICRIAVAGAFSIGILPFIPGDVLKIILAAFVYSKLSRRSKEIF